MDGNVCLMISPPIWSRQKNLFERFAMKFCTDIYVLQRMNPHNLDDPLTIYLAPPAGHRFHLSWEMFQYTERICTTFYTDIHGSQMMHPDDFDDFLTFTLAPYLWF